MRIVLPSEYASESERMFAGTPLEAVRDTNVQDRVTIRVRQNVNEVILVFASVVMWLRHGIPRLRSE